MKAQLLFNPRGQQPSRELLEFIEREPRLNSHCLFQSSGSTGKPKWVALSRAALEASAVACNQHLAVCTRDVFALALPTFHVGGYGIVERARVVGARCVEFTGWQPENFHDLLTTEKVSVTSLVPAQVFDLVRANLPAPASLRAIVVGGGLLPRALYEQARRLGWPLLPSYGLTECCSQVATAGLSSLDEMSFPEARLLPHITAEQVEVERVRVRSPALLSFYLTEDAGFALVDPKVDGALTLPDRVELQGEVVRVHGRLEDDFKILGEWIRWNFLKQRFGELSYAANSYLQQDLVLVPDERRGHLIVLVCERFDQSAKALVEKFNQGVFPFERITHVFEGVLARSALGKILRMEINPICLKEISG